MSQPVTTNPLLIMFINMAVVFVVLWGLSLIIRLIKIIDPTRKKPAADLPPAAAPAPVAAVPAPSDHSQLIAVLAAAVAATGFGAARIVAVRPVGSPDWAQAARLESVHTRNKLY